MPNPIHKHMKPIERQVREVLVQVYTHGYNDSNDKLTIDQIDEAHRNRADLFVADIMDIIAEVIGEDEKRIYSDSYELGKPIGAWYDKEKRNELREEQRKKAGLTK